MTTKMLKQVVKSFWRLQILFFTLLYLINPATALAQSQSQEILKRKQEEFARWKYGMFLHFNMGTFVNKEWANGYEDPMLFNPEKLDCNQWAEVIRAAGMNYAVLTVKHTGGWCLWDSSHTTHDITAFKNFKNGKGDIVKEFVNACRNNGIKAGLYYCLPGKFSGNSLKPEQKDLHGLPPEAEGDYQGFIEKQVTELLTNYGKIDLIWFDQSMNSFTGKDWPRLKALVNRLQPDCIVLANNAKSFEQSDIIGYEYPWLKNNKAENPIPPDGNMDVSEVCDCISSNGRWFWFPGDKTSSMQSAERLSNMIRLCNSRHANYLLNVAPNREGLIEDQYVRRLIEVRKLAFESESLTQTSSQQEMIINRVLQLDAQAATIHGQTARYQVLEDIGNICYWTNPADWLEWQVNLDNAGDYIVELNYSCENGSQGSTFDITLDNMTLSATIARETGSWYDHQVVKLGSFKVAKAGQQPLTLKPTGKPGVAVMNLVWLRLIPAGDYADYLVRSAAERKPKITSLPGQVFVVPNFHPASCGWLANWSVERNYCANSYLDHLDRVRDDQNYRFVMSECNNMIAILNFRPERFAELKERVAQKRVELVNGFFLESTINLSGGEALAKMGIEGLRWQQEVMGARPRFGWIIDVCGTHDQMPQLCAELGLEAMVYTRCNRAGTSTFWSESPDGTRLLTLVPGHYSDNVGGAYSTKEKLTDAQLKQVEKTIGAKKKNVPAQAPVLILGGQGDYALAPARKENPSEFLEQWKAYRPDCTIQFATLSQYVDSLQAGLKSGAVELTSIRAGTGYTFDSFWIESPRVKSWYRRDEHSLQAAETLATIASLKGRYDYPAQTFYHAWLQMLLNTDRNTLWGSAGGMVFEHETSWDARDRFEWVEKQSGDALQAAAHQLAGEGTAVVLFNAANWNRTDPQRLELPAGMSLENVAGELDGDGKVWLQPATASTGLVSAKLIAKTAQTARIIPLPESIETNYYSARIDPVSGALTRLKLKPSGTEMLGGPANVMVAEKHTGQGDPGDFTNARPQRPRLGASSDYKAVLTVTEGPVAITVTAKGEFFGGGQSQRLIRFFKNHPRIEFETELNDIPDLTVVVAEFPLAQKPSAIRRGIPFGFSRDDGWVEGITPAVRWSDYEFTGGGVALLDRGLSGREINEKTPIIYLLNATEKYYGYPNAWLSGKGHHHLEYALVAHEAQWDKARIPQMAWEYNCPVTLADNCNSLPEQSVVKTSDNVIMEVMRRDGSDIEIRLVEVFGLSGTAGITLNLPHNSAALTDMTGKSKQILSGGPTYQFPVRPQQIITLRFGTGKPALPVKPLTQWDELVPVGKQTALHEYLENMKGHPPRGS